MDYERLQKLVAYVLKAVVISNYGDSAQLLERVEDPNSNGFPPPRSPGRLRSPRPWSAWHWRHARVNQYERNTAQWDRNGPSFRAPPRSS